MDLESNLIESTKRKEKGGWKASVASLALHGGFVALIAFLSASATHKVQAEQPIRAFLAHAAAPPPPPPPPPPPAGGAQKATPHPVTPVKIPQQSFVQPREIPKEVPKVAQLDSKPTPDLTPASNNNQPAGEAGGVPGGVAGGVPGGVVGGVVGGTVGGQLGGQLGGQVGGVVGGQVGGTGTEPAPEPKAPDGPLRVGGDVKAPVVTKRVDPEYADMARKARVDGVVIVEAVITKNGDVEEVKVLKGLPFGLSERAVEAVKQWKFKPGTLNGDPVDVIFNLTVNFKLNG